MSIGALTCCSVFLGIQKATCTNCSGSAHAQGSPEKTLSSPSGSLWGSVPTGEKAEAEPSPAGLRVDSVPHCAHRAPGRDWRRTGPRHLRKEAGTTVATHTKECRLHKTNSEKPLNVQTTMTQFPTKKLKDIKNNKKIWPTSIEAITNCLWESTDTWFVKQQI